MKSKMKAVFVVATMLAVGMVSGCGSSGSGSGATVQSSTPGTATGTSSAGAPSAQLSAGAALYASNCAGCHGAITATSIVTPTTLAKVKAAIAANLGGMAKFTSLSDANLQSIADAINNPSAATATPAPAPTPTPTPAPAPVPVPVLDGAALYTSNCSGCHGALATSSKIGVTLARLQAAISGNVGNMGFLSTLTSAQQQAIVTALASATPAPTPTPTPAPAPAFDALTYYNSSCLGCHGSLGVRSAAQIQAAINSNLGGMGSLVLTPAQVAAIAAVSH